MLINLRVPDDSADDRTEGRTRPIARLVAIGVIGAFTYAFISHILPKKTGSRGALDDTDGHLSGQITVEPSVNAQPRGSSDQDSIGIVVALGDTCAGDVVSPLGIASVVVAAGLTRTSVVVPEQLIRQLGAPQRDHASTIHILRVGGHRCVDIPRTSKLTAVSLPVRPCGWSHAM